MISKALDQHKLLVNVAFSFFFLSAKGHEACALLLLDHSASPTVNMQNKDKKTPLHIAARSGIIPVVRELIRLGADCSLVDNEGSIAAR